LTRSKWRPSSCTEYRTTRCARSCEATPSACSASTSPSTAVVLSDSITGAAQRFGDRAALIDADGRRITYAELDRWSDDLAVSLARRHAVREGTVVGLTIPSDSRYVAAYLALAKLGAVTSGINPRTTGAERDRVIRQLAPHLVIGPDF